VDPGPEAMKKKLKGEKLCTMRKVADSEHGRSKMKANEKFFNKTRIYLQVMPKRG
jgi:hypothetical protein